MTDQEKSVRRRGRFPFGHYRKRIVVTLGPGEVLAMRLERTCTAYPPEISAVFRKLAGWHASVERRKQEERKQPRVNR